MAGGLAGVASEWVVRVDGAREASADIAGTKAWVVPAAVTRAQQAQPLVKTRRYLGIRLGQTLRTTTPCLAKKNATHTLARTALHQHPPMVAGQGPVLSLVPCLLTPAMSSTPTTVGCQPATDRQTEAPSCALPGRTFQRDRASQCPRHRRRQRSMGEEKPSGVRTACRSHTGQSTVAPTAPVRMGSSSENFAEFHASKIPVTTAASAGLTMPFTCQRRTDRPRLTSPSSYP